MAYTLADYAKLANDPLKRGVVDIMRQVSIPLDKLSFENSDTLDQEALRYKSLPTIGSRKIGASWSESKGLTDLVTERIVNIGAYIDFDKILLRAKGVVDQKSMQISLFTKAIGLKFNDLFINGDYSTDYDSLTGLRYRLINDLPASQSIDAGGLDISADAAALATNIKTLIDDLHQLCDVCGNADGGPDVLYMGRITKLRVESCLRQSGMLDTTQDAYGRKFATFGQGGPAIVDIGPTDPLTLTSYILGVTESAAGAATGATFSSIFAVKYGGEYLRGFQLYPLDVNDIGMLESGVAERIVIDWPLGIFMTSPFTAARLYDIQAA